MNPISTDGKMWVPAPYQGEPQTSGSIQGVWVTPGQTVEWIWSHGPMGSHVTGYNIIDPIPPKRFGDDNESNI